MYWVIFAPLLAGMTLLPALDALAADQPQWGQAWSRNLVSEERGLPASFDPASGKNIKWSVEIGTETHGTPIIANGRVYIGTNNGHPRDPQHQGDRGVLMCFDEATGKFLWQLVVPKRVEDIYFDWPESGICSAVTVEGDRVYLVDNRGNAICLDALGLSNGNDGPFTDEAAYMTPKPKGDSGQPFADSNRPLLKPNDTSADVLWVFDLTAGAGIWSHDGAHTSALIRGNHLYLNTSTGVDNTHKKIRLPDAPNLVVLDKRTGQFLAREREGIGPNIFHNTWSPPSMADVNGKPLVFLAGGNGVVYAFEPLPPEVSGSNTPEPLTLKNVWQFDFDPSAPKTNVHRFNGNRRESPSNFFGLPVFQKNRIYVAGGGDIWWGKNEAWLKCIDATGRGEITATGLVWSYPLQRHVLASPAVHQGLVYVADCGPAMHCFDAETGKAVWTHEIRGEAWASPMVADGKVYQGTRRGQFYVFAAGREKKVLAEIDLGSPVSSTVSVANRTVYLATMNRLYAVSER